MVKLSGIGCSSKTTAYFVSGGHGFNSVHGRMPSIAMGANAANRDLTYIGVSGDGDTLSIGLGQFCHAIRRNLNMAYIIENNGVYGLTKGQFSASADVGTRAKKGEVNQQPPIDPVLLALTLGATFVARSFSGDKQQLVPLIQAALKHKGFALIDVLSPCVTFNDHEGSTKSYEYTREHYDAAVQADFVPFQREISADYAEGDVLPVVLHDGSRIVLRKLEAGYDHTNSCSPCRRRARSPGIRSSSAQLVRRPVRSRDQERRQDRGCPVVGVDAAGGVRRAGELADLAAFHDELEPFALQADQRPEVLAGVRHLGRPREIGERAGEDARADLALLRRGVLVGRVAHAVAARDEQHARGRIAADDHRVMPGAAGDLDRTCALGIGGGAYGADHALVEIMGGCPCVRRASTSSPSSRAMPRTSPSIHSPARS